MDHENRQLWVGQFKTGTQRVVVFDPAKQDGSVFVLLYLLEDGIERRFSAAVVRRNLRTVDGQARADAIQQYRSGSISRRRRLSPAGAISLHSSSKCEACYAPLSFCRCSAIDK